MTKTHSNDTSDHLGDHQHVSEMSFDDGRLLIWRCILLRFPELLDQGHRLALQATLETSAGTGVDKFHQLLIAEIQQRLQFNTAVLKLAE